MFASFWRPQINDATSFLRKGPENSTDSPNRCRFGSAAILRSDISQPSMGAPTERNLPNKPRIRIFFFGDSICFGQGVSPHFTWVTRLSRALDERFSSRADVLTQNPSVNGNTTRMALERMPYDVQSHAPDVLYIQFGLNDCNGWDQTWRPNGGFVSPARSPRTPARGPLR